MSDPTSPDRPYPYQEPRPPEPAYTLPSAGDDGPAYPADPAPPVTPPATYPPATYPSHDWATPSSPAAGDEATRPAPAGPVFTPGSATVGGPPFSGPASSGPPFSGPAFAGPAFSGPPVGPPMSVPPVDPTTPMGGGYAPSPGYPPAGGYPPAYPAPVSGGPYLPAPVAAPPRKGRGGTVALSIVAVFLLLAAGALAALFVSTSNKLDRTERTLTGQVSERDTTIDSQGDQIDQLRKDLQTSKDELAQTKQTLTGTQNNAEEIKRQKGVIVKCLNLLGEANALADQGKTTQARAKAAEAIPVCDEADRYLVP